MKNNRCAATQTNEILNRKHTNQFKHTTNIQTQTSRIENEKRIATKTADNKKRKFCFPKNHKMKNRNEKHLHAVMRRRRVPSPCGMTLAAANSRVCNDIGNLTCKTPPRTYVYTFSNATIEKMQKMSRFQIANIDRYRKQLFDRVRLL